MDDRKNLRYISRGKDGDKACAGKRPVGEAGTDLGCLWTRMRCWEYAATDFAGGQARCSQPGELSGASAPQHATKSDRSTSICRALEASSDFATGQIQRLAQAAKRLQSTGLGIARGL